ncbi:hypothetical protein [Larkinella terrae]|uniref:Uncharacterized protein n=1 Tax=Larkinella terrae TaxID=2025311 RepID=A0A7K0EDF0_9BACT|nr:hypothetical protein [Larkinella terrae]MRS59805.1 hypothetical protein [Larkinella terrae]
MSRQPKANRYYYVQTEVVLLTDSHLRTGAVRPAPIRLTKQWLTSLGFHPDTSGHAWHYNDVKLVQGTNFWLCVETRKYMQFIHELQDLLEDHYNLTLLQKSQRSTTAPLAVRNWI